MWSEMLLSGIVYYTTRGYIEYESVLCINVVNDLIWMQTFRALSLYGYIASVAHVWSI